MSLRLSLIETSRKMAASKQNGGFGEETFPIQNGGFGEETFPIQNGGLGLRSIPNSLPNLGLLFMSYPIPDLGFTRGFCISLTHQPN